MELKGKKVLVFGSGLSGIGAANLLVKVGAEPVIYDENKNRNTEDILKKVENPDQVSVVIGELSEDCLNSLDLVVMSPGVPLDIPAAERFRQKGLPVWGEVELAYQTGKGRILAITGTNGKTTTTALLGKIIGDYYASTFVVGNIGTPYTSMALEQKEDSVTAVEISSFQLETIQDFKPDVSAILNITEDHLNRHHTMEEYIRVKELITKNQDKNGLCVLNYEDEVLREFGESLTIPVLFFSSARKLERGIYLDGDKIVLQTEERTEVVDVHDLKLIGVHNYENVMAAVAMAWGIGVPMDSIRKSACEFRAVAHRIEYVDEKNGVVYYNDSKGTNPDAAIRAIKAMDRPTLLIGGGYDKNADYTEWIQSFDGKVRYLVLIGATKEKIDETAKKCGFTDTVLLENMPQAMEFCTAHANPGDAVLLSPACASWGEFDNYEQRGDRFKEYVHSLS
ncbi:MAG: UDP-N-acetylmuramoyl-L-alanine--D-glutamate ligase [Lachnospiraceae bacterium]|nr:UDP-N-acetylmuramoyl-L-alanine--D-glutamate ligase [Lachnospiraceae bacterium]